MSGDAWTQVLITLIGAVVTIVSVISGVAVAWINLKGKIAENTRMTQESATKTQTALTQTQSVVQDTKNAAAAAASRSQIAIAEIKAAQNKLQTLMKKSRGDDAE